MTSRENVQKKVNDGSDFQYRMTVDNKYKKAAQYRQLLTKLNNSLSLYAFVSSLLHVILLARPSVDETSTEPWWIVYGKATAQMKRLSPIELAPLIVLLLSAVSSFLGISAVKGNKSVPLRIQGALSGLAAVLAFVPWLHSNPLKPILVEYAGAQFSGEYSWAVILTVMALQEVVGVFSNFAIAFYANALAATMTTQKKDQ